MHLVLTCVQQEEMAKQWTINHVAKTQNGAKNTIKLGVWIIYILTFKGTCERRTIREEKGGGGAGGGVVPRAFQHRFRASAASTSLLSSLPPPTHLPRALASSSGMKSSSRSLGLTPPPQHTHTHTPLYRLCGEAGRAMKKCGWGRGRGNRWKMVESVVFGRKFW